MHSSPCFEIFCAELTHQDSGKSQEDVVFQQSGHVQFAWDFARSLWRHITYDVPKKLGAHWSVFQNILSGAHTSKFRQVPGKCARFYSQGMSWHLAWSLLSHITCDLPKKLGAHWSVFRNILCWAHTPKFWQVLRRCGHFNSQGMFNFPEALQGASQVILHVIWPKNSVHTGLSSEIFYAELTHQNSSKYGEDVLVSTVRACSISLTFGMEPLKSYYMWSAQKTQCTLVHLSKYCNDKSIMAQE
jgi:hypothetical protein